MNFPGIRTVTEGFISLIYPNCCFTCDDLLSKGEQYICTRCRSDLPYSDSHIRPLPSLFKKFYGKVPLKNALTYLTFVKGGRVQKILHKLKYGGIRELAELLGNWYGGELSKYGYQDKFDIILPVPLHKSRQKKRGYNQSALFASGLSEGLGIPWSSEVLQRTVRGSSQTRKGRFERWENVKDVFVVNNVAEVASKRVLLADDVVTTGSTLEACAESLYDAGCKELSIAAIAAAQ